MAGSEPLELPIDLSVVGFNAGFSETHIQRRTPSPSTMKTLRLAAVYPFIPAKVQADAAELRSGYEKVQYCFKNTTKAYEYVKIQ
jgi:hypothetical protein